TQGSAVTGSGQASRVAVGEHPEAGRPPGRLAVSQQVLCSMASHGLVGGQVVRQHLLRFVGQPANSQPYFPGDGIVLLEPSRECPQLVGHVGQVDGCRARRLQVGQPFSHVAGQFLLGGPRSLVLVQLTGQAEGTNDGNGWGTPHLPTCGTGTFYRIPDLHGPDDFPASICILDREVTAHMRQLQLIQDLQVAIAVLDSLQHH
ncbi:unnamed protein product, partial [Ixodes persulcatus]